MHHHLSSWLLAALLSATSVGAQFEGRLTMNLTVVAQNGRERDGGSMAFAISKAGMRGELTLQPCLGGGGKSVVLCRTDTPNINYLITDATQTYTTVDLSQSVSAASPGQAPAPWTVKKLGREKVLGYKTQHVLAKSRADTGQTVELWLARDFLDLETYRKLQACPVGGLGGGEGLNQALTAAGAEGMPLKVVITIADGTQVRMEAVRAEKQSLPAATFEIPAGYSQVVPGGLNRPNSHR